ncbi:hypothetical protein BH18THE1_BH18THE1_17110 [soil metagenome]
MVRSPLGFTGPTKMSFWYSLPYLFEFKDFIAVTPMVWFHINSGLLYLPIPLKYTKLSSGFNEICPGVAVLSQEQFNPCYNSR